MVIDRQDEEYIRRAENSVNRVWRQWRIDFSDKSSKDVLAMVAFQFAKAYYNMLRTDEQRQRTLADFEADLDRMLDITAPDQVPADA